MRKILSMALAGVLMCVCMIVFSGCSDSEICSMFQNLPESSRSCIREWKVLEEQ